MVTKKEYTSGQVVYGFSPANRKWCFNFANNQTFITQCNGVDTAHKVANVINGGLKRAGGIDGMARKNISQLVAWQSQKKSLISYYE